MTISTSISKVVYLTNPTTTEYHFPFKVFHEDEIKVLIINPDDYGEINPLILKVDYTVESLGKETGGQIKLTPFGQIKARDEFKILIKRQMPFTQEIDYRPHDLFPAETHERALDILTMQDQELKDLIGRAILGPEDGGPPVDYNEFASLANSVKEAAEEAIRQVGSIGLEAKNTKGIISDKEDTGQYEAPYISPITGFQSTSGQSTEHLHVLLGSQNSRAYGPARSAVVGSVYSWASGNVSGCFAARQSGVEAPQSVALGTEECLINNGARNSHLSSIFCRASGESGVNIGSRSSYTTSRHNANLATVDCYAGGGREAQLQVVLTNGSIKSVDIINPGQGYSNNGQIVFYDRSGEGSGASATYLTDELGKIIAVQIIEKGADYSNQVDVNLLEAGVYSLNAASLLSSTNGIHSANIATKRCHTSGDTVINLACIDSRANGQGSVNLASSSGTTNGIRSLNLASERCLAQGDNSSNFAASDCEALGANSMNLGSFKCSATKDKSFTMGSAGSSATGDISCVIAGNNTKATATGAIAIGRRIINNDQYSIAFGDNAQGEASTANRKFHLFSNGAISIAKTITGNVAFTDYAEYFENLEPGLIPYGELVALSGRKVRPVKAGDDILGVVSATAFIVAGDSPFHWQGRYLTGDFGELLYQEIDDPDYEEFIPDPSWPKPVGEPHRKTDREEFILNPEPAPLLKNPEPRKKIKVLQENNLYNSAAKNIPRSERPEEWSCVGLLGQVFVKVGAYVEAGDYIKAGNGLGVKSTETSNLKCMEIRIPYDQIKGYAVAFCLIK